MIPLHIELVSLSNSHSILMKKIKSEMSPNSAITDIS